MHISSASADVSMPSAIRACRSFGYDGFRDFMVALAQRAHLTIAVSVPQDAIMRVSTEAYLAHLLVIEILAVRIAQNLGPETIKKLKQFKGVLEQHGVDGALHTGL